MHRSSPTVLRARARPVPSSADLVFGGTAPLIYQALMERDQAPCSRHVTAYSTADCLCVLSIKNKADTYLDRRICILRARIAVAFG